MHRISGDPEGSPRPNPPQPHFIDSTERPQQVVRLSPFRHVAWLRHRLAESRLQSLRLPALVIAFAVAGGATGGLTGAVSQHMKRANETMTLQGEVEGEAMPEQVSSVAVASTPSTENEAIVTREVVHNRRRSFRTRRPRARIIAVYDDFGLNLIPLKKRRPEERSDY